MSRFDEFWQRYPKKVNKVGCKKKWLAKKLDEQADKIFRYLDYVSQHDEKWKGGFIPNPETLINQERWNDFEIPKMGPHRPDTTCQPDPNKVCDWLIRNVQMTEDQHRSPWKWIWDETRLTGVEIPGIGRKMFRDMVGEGVSRGAADA